MATVFSRLRVTIYGPKPVDLPPDPFGDPPRREPSTLLENALAYQPLPVLPQWA